MSAIQITPHWMSLRTFITVSNGLSTAHSFSPVDDVTASKFDASTSPVNRLNVRKIIIDVTFIVSVISWFPEVITPLHDISEKGYLILWVWTVEAIHKLSHNILHIAATIKRNRLDHPMRCSIWVRLTVTSDRAYTHAMLGPQTTPAAVKPLGEPTHWYILRSGNFAIIVIMTATCSVTFVNGPLVYLTNIIFGTKLEVVISFVSFFITFTTLYLVFFSYLLS